MATVIRRESPGGLFTMTDLLAKHGPYNVGRWAAAPEMPDRCYFCPLADVWPAVGVVEMVEEEWENENDGERWFRYGFCERHWPEAMAAA